MRRYSTLRIAQQVAAACTYLHGVPPSGIVHRDLKSQNILIDRRYNTKVWRCRLKPVFASTEQDVVRLGSLTRHPCVVLCDITTCYSIERALFQRLKVNCG